MLGWGGVCVAEICNLRPATGKIGRPFDAVHKFLANLQFYVGALEFTFDLLHRASTVVDFWCSTKTGNLRYIQKRQEIPSTS